jgi:hypothetical protein
MADTFNPKFGAICQLQFVKSNIDTGASSTNSYMTLASGVNTGMTMPYAGSIVALSVSANANVTTATVAFNAHNGGTAYAQESSLLTTLTTAAGSSNAKYSSVRPGVLTFAAGDKIGVVYASATNYAATTVDYDVTLWYVLNPV